MPQTAISDLGADALDSIHAEAITNIYDIFIMLALRRRLIKPHGYGPMTAQEISERLSEVGIDVSVKDVQRRHKDNQALFGEWSREKEIDELLRKKKQTLALTTKAAIAQADFLARAIVALGSRTQRRPSFLYRRRDWAVVPNWSHAGFTTRRATGEEIERDDAFRAEADEHRSRKQPLVQKRNPEPSRCEAASASASAPGRTGSARARKGRAASLCRAPMPARAVQ